MEMAAGGIRMSIDSRAVSYGKIFGDWTIHEMIGKGSNGKTAVFKVTRNNRTYADTGAMKVVTILEQKGKKEELSPAFLENYKKYCEEFCDKAENELNLMNLLGTSGNVVNYHDHKFEEWEDEYSFGVDLLIRMDLLHSLDGLKKKKVFEEQEIIKIGIEVSNALICCHDKGILHRDIKPDNIFFNDYVYMLGDFGISKMLENSNSTETRTGTEAYAAPEQFMGHYDHRVDIYSLGLTLYELANGNRLPFAKTSFASSEDVWMRLQGKELPKPECVGDALGEVILHACNHNPNQRFQNAKDFKRALERLSSKKGLIYESKSQITSMAKEDLYTTMPAMESLEEDLYTTMPAMEYLKEDIYTTMPAIENLKEDLYTTMPTMENPKEDLYTTMPTIENPKEDLYTTMPAMENLNEDLYTTMPAMEKPKEDLYTTMPAMENLKEDLYTTMPAMENLKEDLYTTMPAMEKPKEDLYTTMPAMEKPKEDLYTTMPAMEKPKEDLYTTMPIMELEKTEVLDIDTEEEVPMFDINANPPDSVSVGQAYFDRGEYGKAVNWYRRAISLGNMEATYGLAVCFMYGMGEEKDISAAIHMFLHCAKQSDNQRLRGLAKYKLGQIYETEFGTEKEIMMAEEWYRESAREGNPEALERFPNGTF